MVSKMWAARNMLKSLIIQRPLFADMFVKCLKIGMLSLIARPGCGTFILPKQTPQPGSLACLSYKKSSTNSKTNLLRPEKAMNAAVGSSIRFWQSWCRLLPRKRPIYFDALIRFSQTPISAKSAFTHSWPHPRFPGSSCGKGFGR